MTVCRHVNCQKMNRINSYLIIEKEITNKNIFSSSGACVAQVPLHPDFKNGRWALFVAHARLCLTYM